MPAPEDLLPPACGLAKDQRVLQTGTKRAPNDEQGGRANRSSSGESLLSRASRPLPPCRDVPLKGWTPDIARGSGYGAKGALPARAGSGGCRRHPLAVGPGGKARSCRSSQRVPGCDGIALPIRDRSCQKSVTLETLEHIAGDQGSLRELCRVLHPDGVCILSTPNRAYSLRHKIVNPHLVREYSQQESWSLCSRDTLPAWPSITSGFSGDEDTNHKG